MTATLRGQKEMVETLLALSADAHAVDKYGSNLMDLAGASGNKQLVENLSGWESKYPTLYIWLLAPVIYSIKSLLESGHSINEQDSFGAHPCLLPPWLGVRI